MFKDKTAASKHLDQDLESYMAAKGKAAPAAASGGAAAPMEA